MRRLHKPMSKIKTKVDILGTLGICLTPCSVPGMGKLFNIDPDSMEIGLGMY